MINITIVQLHKQLSPMPSDMNASSTTKHA
jgi:hypothetical protein